MDPTLREFMLQISSSQLTRITWASLLRILMYCLRQRSWVIRAKLGKFCSNQEKVINIEGKYMCVCEWSRSVIVRLFATPWTVAHQASPSMGFFRQEYWSGLSFPSLKDLPDPGIKPIESKNKGQTRVSNSRTLLTILDKDSRHANKPRFH